MTTKFKIWLAVSALIFAGISSLVIAGDLAELTALKDRYEAGLAKVDRSAYVAYTNAVCAFMQQCKSAGDLDGFLVLQNEQKALAALPIVPTGPAQAELSAKVPGYRAMMAKLDADRTERSTALQRQYVGRLDALLKELMAADRIDDAKRVKQEKDAIMVLLAKAQPVKAVPEVKAEPAPPEPPATPLPTGAIPGPATGAAEEPDRGQAGAAKPAKELLITKATFVGTRTSVDVTAAIQQQVVDGALEISDFSFLQSEFVGTPKALMIEYKYRGKLLKNIRRKYGEAISITE